MSDASVCPRPLVSRVASSIAQGLSEQLESDVNQLTESLANLQKAVARYHTSGRALEAMEEETETLVSARGVYAKENEVVYFEKVPEKPAWRVPEGKVIVAEIAYERG